MTTPIRNVELTPDEAITLAMDVAYASEEGKAVSS